MTPECVNIAPSTVTVTSATVTGSSGYSDGVSQSPSLLLRFTYGRHSLDDGAELITTAPFVRPR